MPEPITLGLLATACALGLTKGLSGQVAAVGAQAVIDKLRRARSSDGRDVLDVTHAAFVRSIQAMAAACDITGGTAQDQFSARALARVSREESFTHPPRGDEPLGGDQATLMFRAVFQGSVSDPEANATEVVIAEMESRMGEPLTETHRALFRQGSSKHRSWSATFALLFGEEVKTNERIFRALAFDRLNEVLASAQAHREDLAEVKASLEKFRDDMRRRLDALDSGVQVILTRLSSTEQGISLALLRSLADAFGDARRDDDLSELESYLRSKIADYHQLRERIEAAQHEDNHDAALLAEANKAIGEGEFDKADDLLVEAEALLEERVDRLLIRRAERRYLRGEAARLKGDYGKAIEHFEACASMLPRSCVDTRLGYLRAAAFTASEWGRRLEPAKLVDAAARWRWLCGVIDKVEKPESWANAHDSLGNTLTLLAEHKGSAELFRDAIAAYEEALKVYNKNAHPLKWAERQNNLGIVFSLFGKTMRQASELRKGIAAFRRSLKILTRDYSPERWATTQNNLGNTLRELGQRQRGTKYLEEAVTAFLSALEIRTRDFDPVAWSTTQNNLGNVYGTLAEREEGIDALEKAIRSFKSALEVRTKAKWPVSWAMTQHNLGNALTMLGRRTARSDALVQAVEAYRCALEVQTRDHMPIPWAAAQLQLGRLLAVVAEMESDYKTAQDAVEALTAAKQLYGERGLTDQERSVEGHLAPAEALRNRLAAGGARG